MTVLFPSQNDTRPLLQKVKDINKNVNYNNYSYGTFPDKNIGTAKDVLIQVQTLLNVNSTVKADQIECGNGNKDFFKPVTDLSGILPYGGDLIVKNTGSVARDYFALERTFLSWLRMGVTLVIVGFIIYFRSCINLSLEHSHISYAIGKSETILIPVKSSKNSNPNYDVNALRAIEHYMQKPMNDISIKHTPTKNLSSTNNLLNDLNNLNAFDPKYLNILKERLKKLYSKDVEFQLIRHPYPFLNAKILAQYIALNTARYRLRQIRRMLFKKMPLVGRNVGEPTKVNKGGPLINDLNAASPTKWIQLSGLGHRFLPTHLTGFRMQISGRMGLRKGASRSSVATSSWGRFRFNTMKNTMIDYAKVEKKNQNGAYCVKVWLSSS
ncbi:7000_t:CDS:2 [Diversispora eburnea]|uniref:Small ribosomal subunit protein uS3m n=1 Tax=Diversispora eburnea TaxID=1213867 RepID=A0A9N8YMF6_9GLOM|nr:7000_t:CDS:2 [Diversispora eburnea]